MAETQAQLSALSQFSDQLASVVEHAARSIVTVAARPRQPATGIIWRTDTSLFQPGQLIIEPIALLRPPFFFALERVASLPAPRTRAARQHTLDHPIKTAHSLSCTSAVVCVHRRWLGATSTYAAYSQV